MSPGAYDFAYDAIGNRMTSNVNEQDPTMTYTRNDVNQYTATTGPGTTPAESFTYEKDGTLQTDGKYRYVWDGENRLIRIEPVGTPVNNDKKLEYEYDYMGRRVEKVYSKHNGSDWVVQTTYRFVYDNWNVVLVLLGDGSTRYKFTWGLDLSGLAGDASASGIHGSGGIGGLLANQTMSTPSTDWWYLYDGNGNVTQVIRPTDLPYFALSTWAHFEYDPYGNVAAFSGFMGVSIRRLFCFSTKWVDTELAGAEVYGAVGTDGLYYYGYRYYSPRLGRWISRDPIEEKGGRNLFGFVSNAPVIVFDPHGLEMICIGAPGPGGSPCVWVPDEPPATTTPLPPVRGSRTGLCGCRSCRRYAELYTLPRPPIAGPPGGPLPSLNGHSWIECSDGNVFDFPLGYDSHHNWTTICSDLEIDPDGGGLLPVPGFVGPPVPARCASCQQIKDCLNRSMANINIMCQYAALPINSGFTNCIGAKDRALRECGLREKTISADDRLKLIDIRGQ